MANRLATRSLSLPRSKHAHEVRDLIEERSWFAACNEEILSDVYATFQRMEVGLKLVYGLDFEIIYIYANPWSRQATQASLVEYIIEEDKTPLTLLPGSVEELYEFLDTTKGRLKEVRELLAYLQKKEASDATIEAARRLCASGGLGEFGSSSSTDLDTLGRGLVAVKERYTRATTRISALLSSPRVVPLRGLFKQDVPTYEQPIADRIGIRLSTYEGRAGLDRQRSNRRDAMNIATIIQHSLAEADAYEATPEKYEGSFLRLLTNTDCLLKYPVNEYVDIIPQRLARTTPGTLSNIQHSLAVRSCFEACYATALLEMFGPDYTSCRKAAGDLITKAKDLQLQVDYADAELRDSYHLGRRPSDERIKHVLESTEELIGDPWYVGIIRELLVLNGREHETKHFITDADTAWWQHQPDPPTKIALEHRDKLQQHVLTKIDFELEPKDTEDERLLLEKLGFQGRDFDFEQQGGPKRWLLENTFASERQSWVFLLDSLHQEFYASWPCRLSEPEVLDLVNDLFHKGSTLDSAFDSSGQLLLYFADRNVEEKLCELPLNRKLTKKEYTQLLSLLDESGNRRSVVPAQIICDTSICSITFDVFLPRREEGLMFAFRDTAMIPLLAELFYQTSPWGRRWAYANKLRDFTANQVRRRLQEWL